MNNTYAFRFIARTPVFKLDGRYSYNRIVYSIDRRGKRIIRATLLCEAYAKLLRSLENDSRGKLPLLTQVFCKSDTGWYEIDNAAELIRLAGYAVQESGDGARNATH